MRDRDFTASRRRSTVAGVDGYSISQASQRTGFPATTLPFYEQAGLLHPERTTAGYRSYDDHHIELLSIIGRAKSFGLSLDEITELLSLLDDEQCAPVQGRLRDLIDTKIAEAQQKVAELRAFTFELERVAATLGDHTPHRPCDDSCGCTTDQHTTHVTLGVIGTASRRSADQPTASTLSVDRVGDRLAEWHAIMNDAVRREPILDGIEVILDVAGSAEARPIVDALAGSAGDDRSRSSRR